MYITKIEKMSKTKIYKIIHILICAFCSCLLLTSCKSPEKPSEEERADIISNIAAIVNENYTNDSETPLKLRMTDIEELIDVDSDLYKAIDKYGEVKEYSLYLLDDNTILVVTDVIFQEVEGYVVSNEEIKKSLIYLLFIKIRHAGCVPTCLIFITPHIISDTISE